MISPSVTQSKSKCALPSVLLTTTLKSIAILSSSSSSRSSSSSSSSSSKSSSSSTSSSYGSSCATNVTAISSSSPYVFVNVTSASPSVSCNSNGSGGPLAAAALGSYAALSCARSSSSASLSVRALTGADASLANPRAQKRASRAIRGAAALARVVNLGNVRGDAFVVDARGVARAPTREAHDAMDRRLLRMFPGARARAVRDDETRATDVESSVRRRRPRAS